MHGLAVEKDFAVCWWQDAVQAAQERALAGSVWTDERRRLADSEIEVDVFDRGAILKVDAEVSCPQARLSPDARPGISWPI